MDKGARSQLSQIPAEITAASDYQRLAADFMPAATFAFIVGGAGDEQALRANRAAFESWAIYNRVLANCTRGTTGLTLLGRAFRHPILLAPVAQQGLVDPEAECASAQAADATDSGMVLSTLSSRTLEDVAKVTSAPKWFQLYWQPRRADSAALLRRAEAAGYEAIVFTVDAPVQPMSRRAVRAGFSAQGGPAPNLAGQAPPPQITLAPSQSIIFQGMMSEAPLWDDLEWLVGETALPVIVKGVSHPEDASRCIAAGAAGIVASNHGGRVLDAAAPPLLTLPALRAQLGPDACILLDGGVRSGADVFKAIALGANAVMVGRPQIFALAVAGALGVAHMLKMMRDEFELCMALAGTPALHCVTPLSLLKSGA